MSPLLRGFSSLASGMNDLLPLMERSPISPCYMVLMVLLLFLLFVPQKLVLSVTSIIMVVCILVHRWGCAEVCHGVYFWHMLRIHVTHLYALWLRGCSLRVPGLFWLKGILRGVFSYRYSLWWGVIQDTERSALYCLGMILPWMPDVQKVNR